MLTLAIHFAYMKDHLIPMVCKDGNGFCILVEEEN